MRHYVLDPLDHQQSCVYDWEAEFSQYLPDRRLTKNQIHNLADDISKRYGFRKPEIYMAPRSTNSFAIGSRIHLKDSSKFIAVHEIAHVGIYELVERKRPVMGHGPEFVGFYMNLVSDYFGLSMDFLRKTADAFNVRYWKS